MEKMNSKASATKHKLFLQLWNRRKLQQNPLSIVSNKTNPTKESSCQNIYSPKDCVMKTKRQTTK